VDDSGYIFELLASRVFLKSLIQYKRWEDTGGIYTLL